MIGEAYQTYADVMLRIRFLAVTATSLVEACSLRVCTEPWLPGGIDGEVSVRFRDYCFSRLAPGLGRLGNGRFSGISAGPASSSLHRSALAGGVNWPHAVSL